MIVRLVCFYTCHVNEFTMTSSQTILSNQASGKIDLYFVGPIEDAGDEMKMAFQDCVESGLQPKCVTDEQASTLSAKTDVVIFEHFKGETFDTLKKRKCVRICGPRCIRVCLAENSQIPETNSPVYMTAMRGLVVTATNIDSTAKIKVKEKVCYMGGVYTSNLVESVSHVVCGGVRSIKYDKAVERGLMLMTLDWVDAVWKEGTKKNIHANDSQFHIYKCPVFLNLEITSTNLSASEKNKLKEIINANGGKYSGQLKQNFTDVLVTNSSSKSSEKYKHARSWGLTCVKSSWIYESVSKGFAVNVQEHSIAPEVRCSTPTGNTEELPSFAGSDISIVSSIACQGQQSNKSRIDETNILTNTTLSYSYVQPETVKQKDYQNAGKGVSNESYKKVIDTLSIDEAKNAAGFLDGCQVYLSGFTTQEQDKLRRILKFGGAIIYTQFADAVTHVIAGEFVAADGIIINKAVNRPNVVGVEWLAASLKQRSPALESLYSRLASSIAGKQLAPEPPSPLSQKGMRLLTKPQGEFKTPNSVDIVHVGKENVSEKPPSSVSSSSENDNVNSEAHLFLPPHAAVNRNLFPDSASKLKSNFTSTSGEMGPAADEGVNLNADSQCSLSELLTTDLFKDLVFMIVGFDADITTQIDEAISTNGGCTVLQSFKGITDYTVIPLHGVPATVTTIQSQVVTPYWLDDCCESKSVVPVEYYHQPISIAGNQTPLEGCVITLSIYSLRERQFLSELVSALGALCQETFARKTNVNKGVHGNTHLVTPSSGSSKYNAAIKWNVPVVNKDWLLACAKLGTRTAEQPYLVTPQRTDGDGERKTNGCESNTSATTVKSNLEEKSAVGVRGRSESAESSKITTSAKGGREETLTAANRNTYSPIQGAGASFVSKEFQVTSEGFGGVNSPKVRKLSLKSTPIRNYQDMSTPETPYELAFGETGKSMRKRVKRLMNKLDADKEIYPPLAPVMPARRNSTPLSELMRKAFEKFGNTPDGSDKHKGQNSKSFCEPVEMEEVEEGHGVRLSNSPTSLSEKLAMINRKLSSPGASASAAGTPVCQSVVPPSNEIQTSSTSSTGSNIRTNPNFNSQNNEVGWEEPVESAHLAKVLGLSGDSHSTTDCPSPLHPKDRKFVISNVQEGKKKDYVKMIKDLGATLISEDRYSYETTHLLTERPIRSEKLLCSIAAGRWVLHVSYLDQSYKANMFLPEEDFEWGNPRSKENIPPLETEREVNLANAAFRWRSCLTSSGGAFDGWRAVLYIDNKRLLENISRLVLAGKGTVLDQKSVLEATHCFIDCNYVQSIGGVDFEVLAQKDIYCLPPVYLGNYLTEVPIPDPALHTVDEYQKYSTKHKS